MVWLKTFSAMTRICSGMMVGVILLFLLPLAVPYIEEANNYGYIRGTLTIEQQMTIALKKNIPTKIAGRDLSRWIVIAGAFILSSWFSTRSRKAFEQAQYYDFKRNLDDWKERMNISEKSVILSPLNQKLEQLRTAKKKDREQLLREFAETKRKLDEMGRDLAFLAIDVVDSIGMKQGEERAIVEHDFREYKRFVERTFASYGCLKSTWTPDGVMSAFTNVDAAALAAREVINGLDHFNKNAKTMRRDFAVRCGVNSGFVYFDESVPLEEISDRVIDIAGHMQKHAMPNTVCVGKPVIEPLNERIGFEPSGRMVDGYEVYEWRKS